MTPSPNPAPLDLAQFEGYTPGPWIVMHRAGGFVIRSMDATLLPVAFGHAGAVAEGNAALLMAAPALLAECQRQREEIARLRDALDIIGGADQIPGHCAYLSKKSIAEAARAALAGEGVK